MILSAVVLVSAVSCSTVSSIMQNTFPYTSTIVIKQGSSANTQLSNVAVGTSINQLVGAASNVKDIRIASASVSSSSGQSMGILKNIKVYISSDGNEVLVASRENIGDNIGNSIPLDSNSGINLDKIMKSGNSIQQRIVYELKTIPSSDISLKTSLNFSSVPITNK